MSAVLDPDDSQQRTVLLTFAPGALAGVTIDDFAAIQTSVEDQSEPANPAIGAVLFMDDFEHATEWLVQNSSQAGGWRQLDTCSAPRPQNVAVIEGDVDLSPVDTTRGFLPNAFSGCFYFWYGSPATGNYDFGTTSGILTSLALDLRGLTQATLQFQSWFEIEGVAPQTFDVMRVVVLDGTTFAELGDVGRLNPTTAVDLPARQPMTSGGANLPPIFIPWEFDLSPFAGRSVRLRFEFATGEQPFNNFRGWIIDDVRVISARPVLPAPLLEQGPHAGGRRQSPATVGRRLPVEPTENTGTARGRGQGRIRVTRPYDR